MHSPPFEKHFIFWTRWWMYVCIYTCHTWSCWWIYINAITMHVHGKANVSYLLTWFCWRISNTDVVVMVFHFAPGLFTTLTFNVWRETIDCTILLLIQLLNAVMSSDVRVVNVFRTPTDVTVSATVQMVATNLTAVSKESASADTSFCKFQDDHIQSPIQLQCSQTTNRKRGS